MPEIVFKGKEYVYNHHLTVPYRPLVVDAAKDLGPADLASNLVSHGDNLHALKALLPRYAGQVDLVFIDPPYNTGNEGWCYSDNVSSPIMKEWLSTNPVDGEDMLLRPGIVYTSLSAWGRRGPWKHRRGYDTVVQSATGMAHATGLVRDDPTVPKLQPASPIDYIAGWAMAFGTMAALSRRAREGGSWRVDVSLAACGHWLANLGRFEKAQLDHLADEFTGEELARWRTTTPSQLGELTHLRPLLQLSETVPGWSRPPVPLGSDPAAWPANP